jgi:hypothetical protein
MNAAQPPGHNQERGDVRRPLEWLCNSAWRGNDRCSTSSKTPRPGTGSKQRPPKRRPTSGIRIRTRGEKATLSVSSVAATPDCADRGHGRTQSARPTWLASKTARSVQRLRPGSSRNAARCRPALRGRHLEGARRRRSGGAGHASRVSPRADSVVGRSGSGGLAVGETESVWIGVHRRVRHVVLGGSADRRHEGPWRVREVSP